MQRSGFQEVKYATYFMLNLLSICIINSVLERHRNVIMDYTYPVQKNSQFIG